ncbi:MAG: hypothetical protein P1P64_08960 [Treponemataceae bacterium]
MNCYEPRGFGSVVSIYRAPSGTNKPDLRKDIALPPEDRVEPEPETPSEPPANNGNTGNIGGNEGTSEEDGDNKKPIVNGESDDETTVDDGHSSGENDDNDETITDNETIVDNEDNEKENPTVDETPDDDETIVDNGASGDESDNDKTVVDNKHDIGVNENDELNKPIVDNIEKKKPYVKARYLDKDTKLSNIFFGNQNLANFQEPHMLEDDGGREGVGRNRYGGIILDVSSVAMQQDKNPASKMSLGGGEVHSRWSKPSTIKNYGCVYTVLLNAANAANEHFKTGKTADFIEYNTIETFGDDQLFTIEERKALQEKATGLNVNMYYIDNNKGAIEEIKRIQECGNKVVTIEARINMGEKQGRHSVNVLGIETINDKETLVYYETAGYFESRKYKLEDITSIFVTEYSRKK